MPFVGAGLTGNPKRPFIASKDLLLNVDPTDPTQMRQALSAIKDGFTQVERAINTRAVSAKYGPGANFTGVANSWNTYPFGPVVWDSGKMGNANNTVTAIESGIYHCMVNCFTGATGTFIRILRSNSNNIIQDFETLGTGPNAQVQFSVFFNANYKDFFAAQIQAGSTPSTGCALSSFTVTKICDLPSRYGQ